MGDDVNRILLRAGQYDNLNVNFFELNLNLFNFDVLSDRAKREKD
jgi:hypothetical protein